MKTRTILYALVLGMLAACGDAAPDEKTDDDHADHAGKHGGDLLTIAEHELFLEVAHDKAQGTVCVWIYRGEEMADIEPDAAPVLNMMVDGAATRLTASKDAEGRWVFANEVLKREPERARFTVTIGGARYVPAWAHDHVQGDAVEDDEGEGDEGDEGEVDPHEGHDHSGHTHEEPDDEDEDDDE